MLPLQDLCKAPYNLTVIFFDQLGSGKSTHLRHRLLDHDFWSEEFFLHQVTAVMNYLGIQHNYDLLGHSWGGMLATIHAARQPQGLRRLVVANAPVASIYWKEKYYDYRELMPEPYRTILKELKPTEPKYQEALMVFYKRHFINLDDVPVELKRSWKEIEEDPTASLSATEKQAVLTIMSLSFDGRLGPDEFEMTGSLANFTAVNDIQKITAKTLVVTGVNEGSDHEESIRIFKQIDGCMHVKFEGSTHFPHFEQRRKFMDLIGEFLGS
ncbi:unnamed protein product [Clonostachys byssicola]|uniref:AB hydrolase-1 domain-containing protein n=1 Tax=Clonostachys byssicola TaxID=160290 RepID=A0A9N9UXX6_9HYPO|nr:unnamed protein product [Clonostachys byssicola]